jgi:pimeloyl-ACP methyl ester carboxylesterase
MKRNNYQTPQVPFHALLYLNRVADYLVKERNLFQKIAVSDIDESDQAVYFRANDSPATRAGIAAFPRMISHNREHSNYPLLRNILADLEEWDVPALVLFSDHDTVFSIEQGKRLANRMNNARFELIAGAQHFLQYERLDEVASAIDTFLREGR